MRSPIAFASLASPVFVALLLACSPPDPPTLTAETATITGVTLTGLQAKVTLQATNPNNISLSAQKVVGHVSLNGKPLGEVNVPEAVTIPAKGTASFDVALTASWLDLAGVAPSGAPNSPIPFTVDGTVTIGGDKLNVDLPFHTTGQITTNDMRNAMMNAFGSPSPGQALAPGLMPKGGAPLGLPLSPPTKPK